MEVSLMKINTKRVVSVIITAVMMVVMLPSFAMGESGKKYTETLQPRAGHWLKMKAAQP